MSKVFVKSNYAPRGGYESRSLLHEAIGNRIVQEWELQSIYQGPEVAAVQIMHKYDSDYKEIAWVLQGDTIAKSAHVYGFIDSVIKAGPGQPFNPSQPGANMGQRSRNEAMAMMPGAPQVNEATGKAEYDMSGGASQGTAGGASQSHPAPESKPGLGSRLKTWAQDRAAPAIGRGLQHLGAGLVGGIATASPIGAVAGTAASMYQAHKAKQNPNNPAQKVMGGEGGLAGIAGDAAKQGAGAVAGAAQQQGQNYQQGQGAMGKVGQAVGAFKNMGTAAVQGAKNLGQNIKQGVQGAVADAGAAQQANLTASQTPQQQREAQRIAGADPNAANMGLGNEQNVANSMMPPGPMPPEGAPPGNMQTHPQPAPAGGVPQPQQMAQVDPGAVEQITQDQQGPAGAAPAGAPAPLGGVPGQPQKPGLFGSMAANANENANNAGSPVQLSADTYRAISDILKGL
jgi:hypothetical protein